MDGAGWTGRSDFRELNGHRMPKCLMAERPHQWQNAYGHQAQILSVQAHFQTGNDAQYGPVSFFAVFWTDKEGFCTAHRRFKGKTSFS